MAQKQGCKSLLIRNMDRITKYVKLTCEIYSFYISHHSKAVFTDILAFISTVLFIINILPSNTNFKKLHRDSH
jgi:hypothetical protein